MSAQATVGVALQNYPQLYELIGAASTLGAKAVPVAWRLKQEEGRYLIADSGAKLVFNDASSKADYGQERFKPLSFSSVYFCSAGALAAAGGHGRCQECPPRAGYVSPDFGDQSVIADLHPGAAAVRV